MLRKILSMLLVLTLVFSFGSMYVLAAPTTQTQDAVRVGEDYTYSRVIYYKDGSEITSLETGNITAKIKVKSSTKSAPQLFAVLRYDNGKLAAAGVDPSAPASISTVQEYEATVNVPSTENTKLVTVLWDNAKDMNAICPSAISTSASTGLKSLCLDGKPIEGFDPDTLTYSVYLDDPTQTNAPKVTYIPFDNADKVEVTETTEFPGSTKVKVTPFGGASKEYTITYKYSDPISANELLYYGADEIRWGGYKIKSSNQVNGSNYGLINVSSATIPYTSSPVKVDLKIDKKLYQNALITVRPLNGTNGIDNKVIVNPDGSAITTVDNERAYKTYSVESDGSISRTFYKKSSTKPVTFTPTDGTAFETWVGYELNGDDLSGDTGADIADKYSNKMQFHLGRVNETVKNAEYIPLDFSAQNSGGTFTFYVGQSAIVDVYVKTATNRVAGTTSVPVAPSEITNDKVTVTADDVPVSTEEKFTEFCVASQKTNTVDKSLYLDDYKPYFDLMLAYFDYKGYVKDVHYIYDEEAEIFSKFNSVEPFSTNNTNCGSGVYSDYELTSQYAIWALLVLSSTGAKQTINSSIALSAAVNPKDDARFWNDYGTPDQTLKTREQLKQLFVVGETHPGPISTTRTWTFNDYTAF